MLVIKKNLKNLKSYVKKNPSEKHPFNIMKDFMHSLGKKTIMHGYSEKSDQAKTKLNEQTKH